MSRIIGLLPLGKGAVEKDCAVTRLDSVDVGGCA